LGQPLNAGQSGSFNHSSLKFSGNTAPFTSDIPRSTDFLLLSIAVHNINSSHIALRFLFDLRSKTLRYYPFLAAYAGTRR
jgi:hypothetical protein